jgi:hypothetical protein
MKTAAFAARALLVASAVLCATAALGQEASDFLGAWSWQSTTYGDGAVETPGTTGHDVQLQFSPDDLFLEYVDGELATESTWGLGYAWVEYNGGWIHVAILSTGEGETWEPTMIQPEAFMQLRNSAGGSEIYVYTGTVPAEGVTWGGVKARYRD